MESQKLSAELIVVRGAAGGVKDLQPNVGARRERVRHETVFPRSRNLRMDGAVPGAGVGEVHL